MSCNTENELDYDRPGTYCIGIGGCGGRIVDSILLRRETVSDSEDSPSWERSLNGQAIVDSNSTLVADSYYFSEVDPNSPEQLESDYLVGEMGAGAGKDREFGRELFEEHLDSSTSWQDAWGGDLNLDPLRESNAICLFHSTTGGTGGGGTPVFTRELQESLTDETSAVSESDPASDRDSTIEVGTGTTTPILDVPILGQTNGVAGLQSVEELIEISRLSTSTGAIVPLANEQLRQTDLGCEISGSDEWSQHFDNENETIVHFLEVLNSGLYGQATISAGDEMDISDLLRPIEMMEPQESTAAPLVGASIAKASEEGEWNSDRLEALVGGLDDGKLIDFDVSTARGGVFVFCHPTPDLEGFHESIRSDSRDLIEDFCEFETRPYQLLTYQTVHTGLDAPRLIGLFYNPSISRFEATLELIRERDLSETEVGEELATQWDAIETTLRRDLDFEP
jgi:hypothetical protein